MFLKLIWIASNIEGKLTNTKNNAITNCIHKTKIGNK